VETDLRDENSSLLSAATERAAKAEQAAAEANLERIQLEERISRREISEEQIGDIAQKLSVFSGQHAIVCCFPFNLESATFAGRIQAVLIQADWIVEQTFPTANSSPDGIYCEGFSVCSTSDDKSRSAGMALIKELGTIAGGAAGTLGALDPPARVQIVVQQKLPPAKSRPVAPPQA